MLITLAFNAGCVMIFITRNDSDFEVILVYFFIGSNDVLHLIVFDALNSTEVADLGLISFLALSISRYAAL